jgi:hypothetical protein
VSRFNTQFCNEPLSLVRRLFARRKLALKSRVLFHGYEVPLTLSRLYLFGPSFELRGMVFPKMRR